MDKDDLKIKVLVYRAINDEKFKEEFKKDPKAVLKTIGISYPDSLKIKIVENSKNIYFLIVPEKPIVFEYQLEILPKEPSFGQIMHYIITHVQKGSETGKKLLKNTKEALIEHGIKIPTHISLTICRDSKMEKHIVIPRKIEKNEELSDFELKAISGGLNSYIDKEEILGYNLSKF